MYCTACGTRFEGQYCSNCGKPAQAASTGFPATPTESNASGFPKSLAAALCYLVPVLGPILFLVLAPLNRDPWVRFHAWQALFLQISYFAVHVALALVGMVDWRIAGTLRSIAGVVYLGIVVVMLVKSLQNEKFLLPYIGPAADRQR